MAIFCGVGACGAVLAASLSGHIAVYIMVNREDVNNTICHPEVLYPPIFTEAQAEDDCEFIALNIFFYCQFIDGLLIGVAWAILEYVLMGYSIAATVVNIIILVSIAVTLTGPKEHSNLA